MKEFSLILLVLGLTTTSHAADDIGLINCDVKTSYVWWKHNTGSREYVVESWSRDATSWVAASEPTRSKHSRNLRTAAQEDDFQPQEGQLYRVRGCDKRGDCKISDVVWSPVFACNEQHTAENLRSYLDGVVVETPYGPMIMGSGVPSLDNNVQYNIGLALRELYSMDFENDETLKMKKPVVHSPKLTDYQDLLLGAVYLGFEKGRTNGEEYIDISFTGIDPRGAIDPRGEDYTREITTHRTPSANRKPTTDEN